MDQIVPKSSIGDGIGQSSMPPINLSETFKNLKVCDKPCQNLVSCDKLHICPSFLFSGLCLYVKDGPGVCRFGHDLGTDHNQAILKGSGLEEFSDEELRTELIKFKHNLRAVSPCAKYNTGLCQDGADCPALHICENFIHAKCQDENCNLSHDLLANNCQKVLKHYGQEVNEQNMNMILQDFQAIWTKLLSNQTRFSMDFGDKTMIGEGGFGAVYKARHNLDKQLYAVKIVNLHDFGIDPEKVKREVEILATLKHDCIVKYNTSWVEKLPDVILKKINSTCSSNDDSNSGGRGDWSSNVGILKMEGSSRVMAVNGSSTAEETSDSQSTSGNHLFIQMELCRHGESEEPDIYTLKGRLFDNRNEIPMKNIFCEIVEALVYIHDHNIIHRDLKPGNIFFENKPGSFHIKVGDFGLARFESCQNDRRGESGKHTAEQGTTSYMSPEMLNGDNYDKSTDIYSLAIMGVGMLYPMSTTSEYIHVTDYARNEACPKKLSDDQADYLHPSLRTLFEEMLKKEPSKRPTAHQINDCLKSVNDENIP